MVGPAKGLEHTLSAENMYSINFKAKDSEIIFREHFKRLVSDSIVKKRLRGCVYDLVFDYHVIAVADILDIRKCLMEKMS